MLESKRQLRTVRLDHYSNDRYETVELPKELDDDVEARKAAISKMFLYLRNSYVCVVSFDSCLPEDLVFDVWRRFKLTYNRSFYFIVDFKGIDDEEWIAKASRFCTKTLQVSEIVYRDDPLRPATGLGHYLSLPWIRTLGNVSIEVLARNCVFDEFRSFLFGFIFADEGDVACKRFSIKLNFDGNVCPYMTTIIDHFMTAETHVTMVQNVALHQELIESRLGDLDDLRKSLALRASHSFDAKQRGHVALCQQCSEHVGFKLWAITCNSYDGTMPVTEHRNAEVYQFENPRTGQWMSVVVRWLCIRASPRAAFMSFHFRLERLGVEQFRSIEHPYFTMRIPA